MNDILKEKIEALPEQSGVYIMRDSAGDVIYVGKAVVLKNRVRQYFNRSEKQVKVQAMVDNVADFDYMITLSERDALTLESNLIKKYKPKYNILLKDDKSSPYIKIDLKEDFPTIEVTRRPKRDGSKYFGPYFNGIRVWDVVGIIRAAYHMRSCPKKLNKSGRECLNYHIELCCGPCCGHVTKEEYAEVVAKVTAFLSGRDDGAKELIEDKMKKAADSEEFERAIYYRQQLDMLKAMKERTLANLGSILDIDACHYATNGEYSAVSVCIVRGGKMMGIRNYTVTDATQSTAEAISAFLTQYYGTGIGDVPDEICLSEPFDASALSEYLTGLCGRKTEIAFPERGTKRSLVLTAKKNAEDFLVKSADKKKRQDDMTVGAAKKLERILGLKSCRRMECYDISNVSGVDKVSSMVVFVNGEPSKSDYRRFKIKTVEGANDFASMNETILRRFKRAADGDIKFGDLPDLVVIDGGKGQLSAAYAAMRAAGYDLPMVGLAEREEEIYTLFEDNPIILPKDSFPLMLLRRIRDEAHRFAVTYHRTLRAKRYKSELDNVKGVGEKKRKLLLSAFKTIKEIKDAEVETLAAVKGIDRRTAQAVYDYFRETEKD